MHTKTTTDTKFPLIISLLILGLVTLTMMMYQLRLTEVAVVTTLGKPKVITEPGLHARLPWPLQKIVRFDRRNQLLNGSAREIITQDNINLIVENFTLWKIADPLLFYNSIGSIYEAEGILKNLIDSKQESIVRAHPLSDFIAYGNQVSRLSEIESEILSQATDQAGKTYGIAIEFVGFSRLSLPEANTASVIERMKQEQAKLAAGIRSEAEKEAKIIKDNAESQRQQKLAQAEAEAKRIRGEALIKAAEQYDKFNEDLDFAIFLRKLDALEETMKTKTTVILDPQVPPFDLLQSEPSHKDH